MNVHGGASAARRLDNDPLASAARFANNKMEQGSSSSSSFSPGDALTSTRVSKRPQGVQFVNSIRRVVHDQAREAREAGVLGYDPHTSFTSGGAARVRMRSTSSTRLRAETAAGAGGGGGGAPGNGAGRPAAKSHEDPRVIQRGAVGRGKTLFESAGSKQSEQV